MQHIANSTLLEGLILQFQNETSLFSTSSSGATLEDVASSSETTTEVVEQFLLQNTLSLVGANRRLSSSHQSLNHSEYSPVTLSPQWSRLGRLLLLSALCILGSVGNIFMISSVVIEDYLKRPGNAFIVNIALADLLLTSVSIPSSTILLLAGIDNSQTVCRIQWFLTACVFIVTVLSILATAIENYVRLCLVREEEDNSKHNWFTKANTTGVLLFIWLIGLLLSSFQFINTADMAAAAASTTTTTTTTLSSSQSVNSTTKATTPASSSSSPEGLSYDYCHRKNNQLLPQGVAVGVTATLIPLFVTFVIYLRIHMTVQRYMRLTNFKPNYWFASDLSLAKSNFYSFVIFILFWAPFAVVCCMATTKEITNRAFYNSAWIGMSKSCFYNIIYCLTHRHFRNAYVNLFNYCCCKTSFVATSRRHRNECGNAGGGGGGAVAGASTRPTSDVRVHIIPGYNMYSYTSPQRRDVHEL